MADVGELTINAIAARASFVAKCQRLARTPEAVAQLADRIGIVGNLTKVFYRAVTRAGSGRRGTSWILRCTIVALVELAPMAFELCPAESIC